MPFKKVPSIIYGKLDIDALTDIEVMAFLMLEPILASSIAKYQYIIQPNIFKALLYNRLKQMEKATGWKWKKNKNAKYDKLIQEYAQIASSKLCVSISFFLSSYGERFQQQSRIDNKFKKMLVDEIILYNNVKEHKEKDKIYKKYDVENEQATLF